MVLPESCQARDLWYTRNWYIMITWKLYWNASCTTYYTAYQQVKLNLWWDAFSTKKPFEYPLTHYIFKGLNFQPLGVKRLNQPIIMRLFFKMGFQDNFLISLWCSRDWLWQKAVWDATQLCLPISWILIWWLRFLTKTHKKGFVRGRFDNSIVNAPLVPHAITFILSY